MPILDRRSILATLGAATLPAPLFAADPWAKEPAQWDEKDIQKLMNDSPWSRTVQISVSGPSVGNVGGGGGRGGGRGGRGGGGGGGNMDASSSGGMGGGAMGDGGGPMGGEAGAAGGGGMAPTLTFLIRWQSAKPIKIASVRARMGAEADTSPQAKEFIDRKEPDYVIAVVLPARMGGMGRPGGPRPDQKAAPQAPPQDSADKVKAETSLSWKGHDKVHPSSVTLPKEGQNAFVFHFPKDHPIELDDKEVEFAMRRGDIEIKRKFKLKDMVYNGDLAL